MRKFVVFVAIALLVCLALILFQRVSLKEETSTVAPKQNSTEPTTDESSHAVPLSLETSPRAVVLKENNNTNSLTIQGIVLDENDQPLPGAKLLLFIRKNQVSEDGLVTYGHSKLASTQSDQNGKFVLNPPSSNVSYSLEARAEGYYPNYKTTTAGDELSISLFREAVLIGEVRDATDGTPIPEVEIFRFAPFIKGGSTILTDGQGRFRFSGLKPYVDNPIFLRKDGYVEQFESIYFFGKEKKSQNFSLTRAISIDIRVSDFKTDLPLPNAILDGDFFHQAVRVDSLGCVRVKNLDPKKPIVRVSAPEFISLSQILTPEQVNQGKRLEFRLLRGVTIEGKVTDGNMPISGASVTFDGVDRQDEDELEGFEEYKKEFSARGVFGFGDSALGYSPYQRHITDSEGKFRLSGLLPAYSSVDVIATHPQRGRGVTRIALKPAFGLTVSAEVKLSPAASIFGQLTKDGRPFAGEIWLSTEKRFSEYVYTGSTGQFLFQNLAAGEYSIQATDFDEPDTKIVLSEGEAHRVDLKMTTGVTKPISGTVMTSRGAPIPDVSVDLRSNKEDGKSHRTQSDAKGRFLFELSDFDATYDVHVGVRGISDKKAVRVGTEGLVLQLDSLAKLRFHVVDDSSGLPVSSFWLRFCLSDREWGWLATNQVDNMTPDENGISEINWLGDGVYDFEIDSAVSKFQKVKLEKVTLSSKSESSVIEVRLLKKE